MVRLPGAVDVVPLQGACHFSVLREGRLTANFGGGAIAGPAIYTFRSLELQILWSRHFINKLYQHRPQIAKTNCCVINVENSVTSARSSRQNSLLFSWVSR